MKLLFFAGVLLLVTVSCKKNKDDSGCHPEETEYLFSINKQIDTTHQGASIVFARVNPGNDIVFSYRYSSRTCPQIADDGYMDWLIFQVRAASTSFEYNTDYQLQSNKCYFIHSCFCANVSSRIVSGTIKGTRIVNNKWSVQVDVTEPVTGIHLSFNKQFQLQ